MNSILNYYQKGFNERTPHIQNKSVSLSNSRAISRKKPQSKLSFLKKLFSNNIMEDNSRSRLRQTRLTYKEQDYQQQKGFKKRFLVKNSCKAIDTYSVHNYSANFEYGSQMAKRTDQIIQRYKNGCDFQSFNNQIEEKKQKKQNKIKIVQNNQENKQVNKIPLEDRKSYLLSHQTPQNNVKNKQQKELNQMERYRSFQRSGNSNSDQKQRSEAMQRQYKQLVKIEQMLKGIKKEIKKNRSLIISGVKQLKSYHTNNKQNYICKKTIQRNQMIKALRLNPIEQISNYQNIIKKSNSLMSIYKGPKPVVSYT